MIYVDYINRGGIKHFNEEVSLKDLSELDWSGITGATSVDSATENLLILMF